MYKKAPVPAVHALIRIIYGDLRALWPLDGCDDVYILPEVTFADEPLPNVLGIRTEFNPGFCPAALPRMHGCLPKQAESEVGELVYLDFWILRRKIDHHTVFIKIGRQLRQHVIEREGPFPRRELVSNPRLTSLIQNILAVFAEKIILRLPISRQ